MAHDYSEQMSLMLDGRLARQECVELEAHLAACSECRARWAAFQQIDQVLSTAATFAPAPGFAGRLAARLARQRTLQAARARRERTISWLGVLMAGFGTLALLIVPTLIAAWAGLNTLWEGAPTLFVSVVGEIARWLVTLGAFVEVGRSILGTLFGSASGGPIVAAYVLMLILVPAAWVMVMKNVSRRWNSLTLPALL
jgi:anti-sigma factor RsiW